MKYIDTHAHIYLDHFKKDIDEVIERSLEAGISKIFMPNIDHTTIDDMLQLEEKYPDVCIPMIGLHPCSVKKDFEKELYIVEEWLNRRKFVAIGEMGTDLYWDKTFYEQQKEVFYIQSEWAIKYDVPIVVHCRDSLEETISIVEGIDNPALKGIFHCFNGQQEGADKLIKAGFKLGLGGVVTFKNGGMDSVIPHLDIEHIVLETDCPYLTPVPHRGKRNEPSYIPLVAEKIANLMGKDLEELAQTTTINAHNIFNV